MGQGGACNRCSDVSVNKNAPNVRALDETSSEGEDEEEGSDEEEPADPDDGLEEAKRDAESALQDGLKRGKTSTFKEAIEHATALGIQEDKIQLAQQKLEDHKAFRRREAFEAELHDFLRSEEANEMANCEEKLAQGKEYGINDKALKPLQDRMIELELKRELTKDEVEQAKQFLELCTRRFVASCMAKGREVQWVDLESGKQHKAVVKMDLTLKNFTVAGPPNGELKCKVAEVTAKRAADAQEVAEKSGFTKLADTDSQNAVAVLLPSGSGPWCFLEESKAKQDEFVVAFQVFNGLLAPSPSKTNASPRASPRTSPRASPRAVGKEEGANESNLRDAGEGEDEPASPISPRRNEARKGTGAPNRKKLVDKLKEAKEKEAKEKPPPAEEKEEEAPPEDEEE